MNAPPRSGRLEHAPREVLEALATLTKIALENRARLDEFEKRLPARENGLTTAP
jgi:hypothetical protein